MESMYVQNFAVPHIRNPFFERKPGIWIDLVSTGIYQLVFCVARYAQYIPNLIR